jgi:trans-aconitate 2-methyltransferase
MLRQAFEGSVLTGIDSSHAMIARARQAVPGANFKVADIATWSPDPEADLVFSNAAFQWVPEHAAHLARILAALKPGALMAVQMPDNLAEPSHAHMAKLAHKPAFAATLKKAASARSPLLTPQGYHQILAPHASKLDIWRTTYFHRLRGLDSIVEMLSSTGLRPFLDPLPAKERLAFIADYKRAIAPHYPLMADGTLLYPFPRLFIIALKTFSADT